MRLYSRFLICWCILYTVNVAVDRLVRQSQDFAAGHAALPKDPGDTNPYIATGIILVILGIFAGLLMALLYAVALWLIDFLPQARKLSPHMKSLLVSIALGIAIYQVWNSYTHDVVFSYTAAGVGFASGLISSLLAAHNGKHVLQR